MDVVTQKVQQELIKLGFDLGRSGPSGKGDDGLTGLLTKTAIAKYEVSKGLVIDGLIDPVLLRSLGLEPALPSAPGFPAAVIAAAQKGQVVLHIPASVSCAQWAIESGYGAHMPAGSNNPFGIKAVSGQPYVEARTREERADGSSYYIVARFRKFDSLVDAFVAHAKLLATSGYYAAARAKLPASGNPGQIQVEAFTREMAKHYATAKNYADILIGVMRSRRLYAFDAV